MVKLSNKNVEIDAIILDDQPSQPSNPKPGYHSLYVMASGIFTMVSGNSPVGPLVHDRIINIALLSNTTDLSTGDDFAEFYWCTPSQLNGYRIVDVDFWVAVSGSTGSSFQVHNVTQSLDILSGNCTIDANEFTSYTAGTPPTINTSNDKLFTGDLLRFDCDTAGTGAKGAGVTIVAER